MTIEKSGYSHLADNNSNVYSLESRSENPAQDVQESILDRVIGVVSQLESTLQSIEQKLQEDITEVQRDGLLNTRTEIINLIIGIKSNEKSLEAASSGSYNEEAYTQLLLHDIWRVENLLREGGSNLIPIDVGSRMSLRNIFEERSTGHEYSGIPDDQVLVLTQALRSQLKIIEQEQVYIEAMLASQEEEMSAFDNGVLLTKSLVYTAGMQSYIFKLILQLKAIEGTSSDKQYKLHRNILDGLESVKVFVAGITRMKQGSARSQDSKSFRGTHIGED